MSLTLCFLEVFMKKNSKKALLFASAAILFCFMACNNNSSSGENSGNGSGSSNPFAGTEWSSGGTSLKFYSDGTVGGNGTSTGGELRYKVSSGGGSYTATIYVDAYGQTMNFATLAISSENATSGTYKLDGSDLSTTLKKVGGTGSNGGGAVSSDNTIGSKPNSGNNSDGNDNNDSSSNNKGTKGGSSGDQFMNTTWSGEGFSLDFGDYGYVSYGADGMSFYYEYYFNSTGGSYIAKIYDNNTLMLTFEFSIASPTSGKLTFGSNTYNYRTLERYSAGSNPTPDYGEIYESNESNYYGNIW